VGGKGISAEAFLKGLDNIKLEAANGLNRAYIPILQRISPGEIQHAQNALDFAKRLVKYWLKDHKFKNWTTHRTHNPGTPVTEAEKDERAEGIANDLCNHSKWLSHGRSIKLRDLRNIGLEVTDFSATPELADAIRRYHILLQMTFDTTNIYKVFETATSQIYRFIFNQQIQLSLPVGGAPAQPASPIAPALSRPQTTPVAHSVAGVVVQYVCNQCKKVHSLQADFDQQRPLQTGLERFPINDILICNQCGSSNNLIALRRQIELQTKRRVTR
jgi:hypothetical protein